MKYLSEYENDGVITLGRGIVISKEDMQKNKGDYPVYSSSATGNGLLGKYGLYSCNDERITWSIDGGGKLFYREPHKYSVTNVCGWLKVNDSTKFLTKYVYYSLYHQWTVLEFNYVNKAHPSIIRNIYSLNDCSIDEQHRIVNILDRISTGIEKEKALIPKYNELIKSRFIEMFGTNNYFNDKLGNISTFIDYRGGTPKLTENAPIRMVNAKSVGKGFFKYVNEFITEELYNTWMRRGFAKSGDILFVTEGHTFGNVCLIPDNLTKFALGQRVITICGKQNIVNNIFLFSYMQTEQFMEDINIYKGGGTAQGIRSKDLVKISIPIPPLSLQNEFAEFVKQIDKLKFVALSLYSKYFL